MYDYWSVLLVQGRGSSVDDLCQTRALRVAQAHLTGALLSFWFTPSELSSVPGNSGCRFRLMEKRNRRQLPFLPTVNSYPSFNMSSKFRLH